ncbi:MAG: hypothetical protein ACRECY_17820, partial [Phyllobacterium sp.]
MSFFQNEAQYQTIQTAWDLGIISEINGIGDLGGLADGLRDADGKFSAPGGWRLAGSDNGKISLTALDPETRTALKLQMLKSLGLDTEAGLRAAGIDERYRGDDGASILSNPLQLIDDGGYLRGFNKDGEGNYTISPLTGAQLKVFFQYDDTGVLVGMAVVTAGSNSTIDLAEKDAETGGSFGFNFEYVLKAMRSVAEANGLDGSKVLFTGYSMGGGVTNSFHYHKDELAGGFFSTSHFVGLEGGFVSPKDGDGEIFNFGMENDLVYGLSGYGSKDGLENFAKTFEGGNPFNLLFLLPRAAGILMP